MNDINQPDPNHNPQEPIAFCQNCSAILTHETVRKVGANVFCEPCLAARLASPPPPPGSSGGPDPAGYRPVNTGASPSADPADTVWQWGAGMPKGWAPGQGPNPGLAALLGLIPGVGAMYNEQYAKGVAHLLIFAVLVMFSHIEEIFGLFVFGWICYMSIEAHHTAKARRDGTPLPNPFGLNDIGERMGFNQSPGAPFTRPEDIAAAAREAARDAASYAAANFNRPNPYARGPIVTPPPATPPPAWGAPAESHSTPPAYAPPFTQQPYTSHPPYTEPFMPPTTAVPPYAVPPFVPQPVSTQPRFPVGAIVLIGLGMLFLLNSMNIFHAVPGSALVGLALLAFGVRNFLSRMSATGTSLAYDGTPDYNLRVVRALDGSVWLMMIGLLFLLDSLHIMRWGYSWPWIIILVGVMMLVKRTAYNNAAAAYAPPVYPPNTPYAPPASEPIITPTPSASSEETRSGNEGAL